MEEKFYELMKKSIATKCNNSIKMDFESFQKLIDEEKECYACCTEFNYKTLKAYIVNGNNFYVISFDENSSIEVYDKKSIEKILLKLDDLITVSYTINNLEHEINLTKMNEIYSSQTLNNSIYEFVNALKQ